jgi:hypothetical protein
MKNAKNTHLLVLAIFLILNLIPHVYVSLAKPGVLLNWYLTDDAFYYFKTAQNITEGHGITFDGLSPTNGFHPLWMLFCIPVFALARFDLYLPLRILVVVQGLLNAASGYFLYRILAEKVSKPLAILAASLWMFLIPIHSVTTKLGLESGINALSIFWLVFLTSRFQSDDFEKKASSLWLIGLAGVICLFSRLDNIFIVGMIGIWLVFHDNQIRCYAMLDFFLITLSVLVSYYVRIQVTDNIFNFLPFAYTLLISSLVIKPLLLFFFGGYRPMENRSIKQVLLSSLVSQILSASLNSTIIFLLFEFLDVFMGYSRSVLILDFLISTLILTGIRLLRWRSCRLYGCDETDVLLKENWQTWLSRAASYFLPVLGSLAAYMAFNKFYAGSAMPVSGKVKHWWGTLPNTIYGRPVKLLSGIASRFFDSSNENGPFWLLASPIESITRFLMRILNLPVDSSSSVVNFISAILWIISAAFLFMMIYRYREEAGRLFNQIALPALAVGCFIQILSYQASGYLHTRYWYWISEMALIILFLSIIIGISLDHVSRRMKWSRLFMIGLSIIPIIPFLVFGFRLVREFPLGGGVPDLYDVDGEKAFVDHYTQPGDVIGMTGGGLLGYFMPDRTFVNLDGLINSARYFEFLQADQTEKYLKEIGMDYVYGERGALLDSDPFRWMFTDRLTLIAQGPYFWLFRY